MRRVMISLLVAIATVGTLGQDSTEATSEAPLMQPGLPAFCGEPCDHGSGYCRVEAAGLVVCEEVGEWPNECNEGMIHCIPAVTVDEDPTIMTRGGNILLGVPESGAVQFRQGHGAIQNVASQRDLANATTRLEATVEGEVSKMQSTVLSQGDTLNSVLDNEITSMNSNIQHALDLLAVTRASAADTVCNTANIGVIKYKDGKLMVCGASGWTLSASIVPGLTNDPEFAADSCDDVAANPMAPVGKGVYLVRRGGVATTSICAVSISASGDRAGAWRGGDGSSSANPAESCELLEEIAGAENFDTEGEYWIDSDGDMSTAGSSKVQCKLGFWGSKEPSGEAIDGQVTGTPNKYCWMKTNHDIGDKTIEIDESDGCSRNDFANKKILVIQMQGEDRNQVGEFFYTTGAATQSTAGHIELKAGLDKRFFSGVVSGSVTEKWQTGKSGGPAVKSAQLIMVPQYRDAVVPSGQTTRCRPWNGKVGGVFMVEATRNFAINGNIDVNYRGFRGGQCSNHGCNVGGYKGESWTGNAERGRSRLTCHCCGCGGNQRPNRGENRGDPNGGGGAGGAGSCHGGGGGGGSYSGSWAGYCSSNCRIGSINPGWGSPECNRAGYWAMSGDPYGEADGSRMLPGSGGGGGNNHSPECGSNGGRGNMGGHGGGLAIVAAAGTTTLTGRIYANGDEGHPNQRQESGRRNWWQHVNSQDGSGGGGSGGQIVVHSHNFVNRGELQVHGGQCPAYTGWSWHSGHHHQKGGRGGYGRIRVTYTGTESGSGYSPNNPDVVSKAQVSTL